MRALGIFAVACGLVAVVACAAPTPENDLPSSKNLCAEGDDCPSKAKQKKTDTGSTLPPASPVSTPTAAPTTPPPSGTHDAGADSSTAPPVTTTYCRDLNGCCGSLTSTFERLACLGVAIAGKETPCRVELAVCSAGGIGAIGGGGGNECADLTTCCNQMANEGYYDDAYDCRGHLSGNNAGVCSSWLTDYRDMNWCN